jgi:HSP20 family protein
MTAVRLNQLPLQSIVQRFFSPIEQVHSADSSFAPRVNVIEDANHYLIAVDLPGVAPETVEIVVEQGQLIVRGERATQVQGNVLRSETLSGKFSRSFNLPETVNPESIVAASKHGVLEISLPKVEKPSARRISVQAH